MTPAQQQQAVNIAEELVVEGLIARTVECMEGLQNEVCWRCAWKRLCFQPNLAQALQAFKGGAAPILVATQAIEEGPEFWKSRAEDGD